MKKMTILIDGKPTVIKPEATIELDEANPLTSNEPMRTVLAGRDYDIIADFTGDYKPLGENEGRIGYFHVCEDGEINAEPINVCEYEINRRPVRLPC